MTLARKFSYQSGRNLGHAEVMVDGEDISNLVRGVSFDVHVGEIPKVELDLVVSESVIRSGYAQIFLKEGVRELLIKYGWTPPAEESA